MLIRTLRILLVAITLGGVAHAQVTPNSDPSLVLPAPNTSPAPRKGSSWVGRSKFIRSHWVRLTPNGDLTGKISLLDPSGGLDGVGALDVSVYRKGTKVATARTDEQGNFTIANLDPGVYALIARGSGGFVAYGLHVLQSERQAQSDHIHFVQAVEVGETLSISTAAVPPTFEQLRGILRDNFDRIRSNFVPPSEYAGLLQEAEREKQPGSDEPEGAESLRGTEQLQKNPTSAANTRAATTTSVHDIVLEPARRGWMMRGRLYGIDPDTGRSVKIEAGSTEVTLIQNDKRVAVDTVRAEGEFDFYGLDEGVYSLVAVGEGGFGAVAFRAVRPPEEQASQRDANIHFVQLENETPNLDDFGDGQPAGNGAGANAGTSLPFALALIDDPQAIFDGVGAVNAPQVADIVGDSIIPPGQLAPPPGQAPVAQSGGFASGGSVGRLLGVAAIATAIAVPTALSRNGNRQLVSPFAP